MESRIRHKLDVVILALFTFLAAASEVNAQGLLFGAADSTYYVARRGAEWSVIRLPGYWVPRNDGFWTARMSIPSHLWPETPADSMDDGEEDEGEASIGYLDNDWCFGANVVAHRYGVEPRYGKQDENCSSGKDTSGDVSVTFLGPQYVGFDMNLVTDARNGYDKGSLFTWIDSVARYGYSRDYESALPQFRLPLDSAAEEQAWRACRGLPAEADDDEDYYMLDDIGVGLTRSRGRWVYYSRHAGMSTAARGQPDGTCMMPVRVPADVVGFEETTFDWRNLPSNVKNVVDTFVSPKGEVLGVLTRDGQLTMYRLEKGVPRERLFATPVTVPVWCGEQWEGEDGCTPTVMVQWSTGSHIERWWNTLKRIAATN